MRVFLGVTGASGAPYARRLLQALAAADCEVGVSVSGAAIEVLATELYGDARLSRDETLARFTEGTGANVTVYEPNDWQAPYASGSAKVDAYVICPCSMGTLGTIASGAMQNLIHRAASVALKEERKLVLCPRETPLSAIHLENMLDAAARGRDDPLPRARLLPRRRRQRRRSRRLRRRPHARPARPRQLADREVGHVTLAPDAVRTMFDRIAPVYDVMNRVMTAGLDMRWRRLAAESAVRAGRPRARRGLRHRRPRARRPEGGRRAGDRARLLRDACSSARAQEDATARAVLEWVQGDLLALPFADATFDAATVGFGVRNVADLELGLRELRRVLRPGGRLAILEITQPRGVLRPFFSLWFDRDRARCSAGCCPAAPPTLPARVGEAVPGRRGARRAARASCGFGDVRFRLLAGSIVALHTGAAT